MQQKPGIWPNMRHIVKKTITFQLLLVFFVWGHPFTSGLLAREQDPCLSCHQYPGLVRLEKNGGLKVLHVDEQKYLASSHGHLACRACHLAVDKIPHVGTNKTDCQSQCHQSDKDQSLLANTPRKGFHTKQQSVIVSLEDRTSCKVCHQIYPHSKEPFVRSFLNMHTGYLACEVCHLKRSKFNIVSYDWVNTEAVVFEGKPFGSVYDPRRKSTRKPEASLSRISPFVMHKGKPKALMNTWDTQGALKVSSARTRLDEDEKKLEIRHYHRDVVKMERTTACEECHARNGLLDFRALGFSQDRAEALMTMPIGNIIKKYDAFYLPKLGGM